MKVIRLILPLSILLVSLYSHSTAQSRHSHSKAANKAIIDTKANWEGKDIIPPLMTQVNLTDFISKQMEASAVVKNNKINIKMEISAVVETDGTTSTYKVKGTGPADMGTEYIRILKMMPKYKPGTKNGKPARFRCYYPFELKYTAETKISKK